MPRQKTLRPVPKFESEAGERAFWEAHDTVSYVDWRQARIGTFPDLKPSTETISLRLPAGLFAELKTLANKRDVPYQSLLRGDLRTPTGRFDLTYFDQLSPPQITSYKITSCTGPTS